MILHYKCFRETKTDTERSEAPKHYNSRKAQQERQGKI